MPHASLDSSPASASASIDEAPDNRFYLMAWRWHFYAGIFVMPFLMILAATGMMMMYIGYFDGRDGENIVVNVPTNTATLTVIEQSEKALEAISGGTVVEWLKAPAADRVSVFRIKAGDTQNMVAVDPYTGNIVEIWDRRNGWYDFADGIHSELLIGTIGDRILEIAAGFGIMLTITGLYLWWPRKGSALGTFLPGLRQSGRALWKSLHGTVGIYLSAFLLLFLISGMSWTGVWGGKLVQAWSTFPTEKWSDVPLSDETHASMNHGAVGEVPWALEQTPMPASGSEAGIAGVQAGVSVDVDSIAGLGNTLGLIGRFHVVYPNGASGVWTLNQDSMNSDSSDPMSDRTIHIDQYTGRILADVGFSDYSLGGKVMAISIPFHMGLVGLWNLVLNTVVCFSVLFLSVTGIVMWWMRRPNKSAARLFPPQVPADRPHWRSAMLIMLAVSMAFPLTGLTLIAVLALDLLVFSRIRPLQRAFT